MLRAYPRYGIWPISWFHGGDAGLPRAKIHFSRGYQCLRRTRTDILARGRMGQDLCKHFNARTTCHTVWTLNREADIDIQLNSKGSYPTRPLTCLSLPTEYLYVLLLLQNNPRLFKLYPAKNPLRPSTKPTRLWCYPSPPKIHTDSRGSNHRHLQPSRRRFPLHMVPCPWSARWRGDCTSQRQALCQTRGHADGLT